MADCCHSQPSCSSNASAQKQKADWLLRVLVMIVGTSCLWQLLYPSNASFVSGGSMAQGWVVFSDTLLHFMEKAWMGLVLGVLSVGVLSQIPKSWVQAVLGNGKTVSGIFRAAFAGLLLDTCSHGVLMIGMKLYERGASYGQVVAFLLATPWNSLSLTFILWGLIGLKWTVTFVAFSFLIGIVSGLLANQLERTSVLNLPVVSIENLTDEGEDSSAKAVLENLKNVPHWLWQGLLDSRMVLRWVLLGAVCTGLIRAAVPLDMFQHWFGPSLAGLGLTLVAATVIEICSEGSVPIAADLVTRAMAPGNGFTFLMAGVSTDITELLAVRDTMKSWRAAIWIPLMTVPQVLLLAWLMNQS